VSSPRHPARPPGETLGAEPTEADLSFSREKPRSPGVAAMYRLQPVIERVAGRERRLRWLLAMEKLYWRLAYEAAGAAYGDRFQNHALAIPLKTLEAWLPAGARVLDFGCGHGRTARVVAPLVGEVVGVDVDAAKIRRARERNACANARFLVGDARELLAEPFDVVMLIHVIEHLGDPVKLLADVRRTAPRVIVEVPLFDRDPLNAVRLELGSDFSSDADHLREYTKELLTGQLAQAGWTICDWSRGSISLAALAER